MSCAQHRQFPAVQQVLPSKNVTYKWSSGRIDLIGFTNTHQFGGFRFVLNKGTSNLYTAFLFIASMYGIFTYIYLHLP